MEIKQTALPQSGLLRLSQVLTFIPVSKSNWLTGVKSGIYPASVKLSVGITCWRAEDIHALIASVKEGV